MKKSLLCATLMGMALTITGCGSDYDFATLPEYKGLEISTIVEANVTDSQVNARVQSNLAANVIYENVTDRAVQKNDIVNMDIDGKVDGNSYTNGTLTAYDLKIGSESLVKGFDQAIIGRKIGSEFIVNLEFPSDYYNSDVAGKPVEYTVKINGIRVQIEPVLDDNMVQKLSTTATTVEEYRLEIRKQLESEQANVSSSNAGEQLWNQIMNGVEVEKYPTSLLNDEVELIEETYIRMADLSGVSIDVYVTDNLQMDADTFKAQNLIQAEFKLKELATIITIAKKEKLTPTNNEYVDHYSDYFVQYGCNDINELLAIVDEETLQRDILFTIVKDFLVKNAVQTDK